MTDVLILGASARAAVHSARRAGLTPHAVDLFMDRDAAAYAPMLRCELTDYPDGLEVLADQFPPMPWLYTGGLENHPALVDRIAAKRPLWGNDSSMIAKVRGRDFLLMTSVNGSACGPAFIDDPEGTQAELYLRLSDNKIVSGSDIRPEARWVRKSYRSTGGSGVAWAVDLAHCDGTYLQEHIPGQSIAVCSYGWGGAFETWKHVSGAQLNASRGSQYQLGGTEQLVGIEWLHAKNFQYAGSIGPLSQSDEVAKMLNRVLDHGGLHYLNAVWGADFIDHNGTPVLIEVNPRYTASMEVLEHATGRSVFDGGTQRREPTGGVVGKAVYYAPHSLRFPEVAAFERAVEVAADPWALPEYADIPRAGDVIDAGQPVLTFFDRADDAAACRAALQARAAELDALFARHRVGDSG